MTAPDTSLPGSTTLELDRLDPAALDALPYGAIQLDSDGIITFYNAAESALSGRKPERVLGRNFFLDVAPCTNIPGFYGRFLEGVRAGALDVEFEFVFDFLMAPVKVRIRMRKAAQPDRWWIMVHPLEQLQPSRSRAAEQAVEQRRTAVSMRVNDMSICEREPIHQAGGIQPHGTLIGVDCDSLEIRVAAENTLDFLGLPARALIGRNLDALLSAGDIGELRSGLETGGIGPVPDFSLRLTDWRHQPLSCHVHRRGDVLFLEFEPAADLGGPTRPEAQENFLSLAARRANEQRHFEEITQSLVRSVRAHTGFERVMLYRFDTDGHGEVVGEDKVTDWPQSFLGLHFPDSDIPAQARRLYREVFWRAVPNREYQAVPLLPADDPATGQPWDIGAAVLRSLSPIHREYHRNVGVNGAMSVSVIVEGRLWGLLIGHHRQPHYVSNRTLKTVHTLLRLVSDRLVRAERTDDESHYQQQLQVHESLLRAMAGTPDFFAAMTEGPVTILDLFGASGACVVRGTQVIHQLGDLPPGHLIAQLVERLETLEPGLAAGTEEVLAVDCISGILPSFETEAQHASGVLAAMLDAGAGDILLWFRPEQIRTVSWAGNPGAKEITADAGILPRRSFERWVELRRGYCVPWQDWEINIAVSLVHAINGVIARQTRRIAALNEELEKSNRVKDDFLAHMSHELRTPLNAIIGFSELIESESFGPAGSPRYTEYASDIHASGRHLLALINDILDLSKLEAGALTIAPTRLSLAHEVQAAMQMYRVVIAERDQQLVIHPIPSEAEIFADQRALKQVLLNLISNATKFSPSGGIITLTHHALADGGVELVVSDTGRGISAADKERVKRPFEQVCNRYDRAHEGTGLGLALSAGLMRLHGGELRIDSELGKGTAVHVTFPPDPAARSLTASGVTPASGQDGTGGPPDQP